MVKVLSDSTCDLSQELLDKYDISIIPLHIVKGEEELEDGTDIDISALYEWADLNRTTPKTSAPSFETAMEIMKPFLDEGEEDMVATRILYQGIHAGTCMGIRLPESILALRHWGTLGLWTARLLNHGAIGQIKKLKRNFDNFSLSS